MKHPFQSQRFRVRTRGNTRTSHVTLEPASCSAGVRQFSLDLTLKCLQNKCERGGEERCKSGLQWTLHQSAHWSDGCHPPRFWVKKFSHFPFSFIISLFETFFFTHWSSFLSKTLVVVFVFTMLHHNTNTDSLSSSSCATIPGWVPEWGGGGGRVWGQHAYLTWSITMAHGHTNTHWHKRTSN